MTLLKGRPVGILGTGMHMPAHVITNDDLSRIVDTNDEWIVSHTGIKERRAARDGETNSSISAAAARDALTDAGMSAEQVDMIVVGTNSPDTLFPGVGPKVQGLIGATNAGGMDVQAGCPGSIHALAAAAGGVASEIWNSVIVVGSEVLTSFLNYKDRSTCPLFGDGAAACVLGPHRDGAMRITHIDLKADGDKHDLIELPGGMSALPATDETVRAGDHFLRMKGHDVYKFVNRVVPSYLEGFCEQSGASVDDIDVWIFHQANIRIMEAVSKRMNIPMDRFVVNLDRYGNTSAASVMIALHEARCSGTIHGGQRIVMTSFGAGMTYGAVMIES